MNTTEIQNTTGKMPVPRPVHIMLDIETLGTAPGSVITSIGACVFDETGPSENPAHRHEVHIDASRSVEAGLVMDASTVLWWLTQKQEAREALVLGQKTAVGPNVACFDFVNWLDKVCPEAKALRVWGKGPSFDCGLLVDMCRKVGARQPWRYSGERCVRSAMELRPDIAEPERAGIHHTALDDALHQARHVGAIMKAMRTPGSAGGSPAVSEVSRGGAESAEESGAMGAALAVVDFVNGGPSLDKMPKHAVSVLRPLTRGEGEGALFETAAFILAGGVRCFRLELNKLHAALRAIRDYGRPEGDGDPDHGNDLRAIYDLVVSAIGEWKSEAAGEPPALPVGALVEQDLSKLPPPEVQMAKRLTGRRYGNEITHEEGQAAGLSGLLVVYCASDDLVELDGVIRDELPAINGKTFTKYGATITASRIKNDWEWFVEADVPFEPFEIFDGSEKYCRGIVINTKKLASGKDSAR